MICERYNCDSDDIDVNVCEKCLDDCIRNVDENNNIKEYDNVGIECLIKNVMDSIIESMNRDRE